jgi:cation:H+ antiporter
MDWFDLVFALFVILLGAQLFTNGVEWVGEGFGLSEGMVGSVLAAIGTALPETMVPLVAILAGGHADSDEIGIGAILGAPFMLGTLAMAVLGASALGYAKRRGGRRAARFVHPNPEVIRQDLVFFLLAYPLSLVAGIWHVRALHVVLAIGLVVLYAFYVRKHLLTPDEDETPAVAPPGAPATPPQESEAARAATRAEHAPVQEVHGEIQPLYVLDWYRRLTRSRKPAPPKPPVAASVAQTVFALILIIGAARIFVVAISHVSEKLGVSSLLFALLVAPVATELPEQFNGVIWLRRRKDTLAIGNVTGASVFQSTFPVTIGLLFTTWTLDQAGLVSGIIAIVAALISYLCIRLKGRLDARIMVAQALLYVGYVVYVLARG